MDGRRVSRAIRWLELGVFLAILCALPQWVSAMDVTVEWDPVAHPYLSHYVLHWGTSPGSYNQNSGPVAGTSHTVTGLMDGQIYHFAIKSVSTFGDESPFSAERRLLITDDPADGFTVDDASRTAFTVSGRGADPSAGVAVEARDAEGAIASATATVAGDGVWSASLDLSGLAEGSLEIEARSGIVYSRTISGALVVTPTVPLTLALDPEDDTGISPADRITNRTTGLTITSSGGDGSTVRIYDGGSSLLAEGVISGGAFVTDMSLAEGNHSLTARYVSPAGGEHSPSAPLSIRVDRTGPSIAGVAGRSADGVYSVGQAISLDLLFSEPVMLSGGSGDALIVTFNTGSSAALSGMAGAQTVPATYVVMAGESADRLSVASVRTTAGASLTDTAGNTALLTVPAGQNLADTSLLIVDGIFAPRLTQIIVYPSPYGVGYGYAAASP